MHKPPQNITFGAIAFNDIIMIKYKIYIERHKWIQYSTNKIFYHVCVIIRILCYLYSNFVVDVAAISDCEQSVCEESKHILLLMYYVGLRDWVKELQGFVVNAIYFNYFKSTFLYKCFKGNIIDITH